MKIQLLLSHINKTLSSFRKQGYQKVLKMAKDVFTIKL